MINPANSKPIGELGHVSRGDLDKALAAADKGFKTWRRVSAFERGKILRKAAELVRARADEIAKVLTQEQGKILAEAKLEVLSGADIIDWYAGEGQRAYGRIIPARADGVRNMVIMEPIGPVAGFSPWNFPVTQAVRKIAASLAAGCSIIIKCPEETPGSPIGLVKCFHDAGVPAGVINLVYGVPAEISEYLIPHPIIRKISFTGSVAGRQAPECAGGQPHEARHHGTRRPRAGAGVRRRRRRRRRQADGRHEVSQRRSGVRVADALLRAGEGLRQVRRPVRRHRQEHQGRRRPGADSKMGPLANPRRVNAIEAFIADAQDKGAKVATGGKRIGNQGNFFEPTVLTDVPENARIMNEEPFGPVAVMLRFKETDDVLARANKLPFGLASYAFTKDAKTATKVADALDCGMVTINHFGIALPETPFGGVKDFRLRPRRRHRGPAGLHAGQVHQPYGLRGGRSAVGEGGGPLQRVTTFAFFLRGFLPDASDDLAAAARPASARLSLNPEMIARARTSMASTNCGHQHMRAGWHGVHFGCRDPDLAQDNVRQLPDALDQPRRAKSALSRECLPVTTLQVLAAVLARDLLCQVPGDALPGRCTHHVVDRREAETLARDHQRVVLGMRVRVADQDIEDDVVE